MLSVKKTNYYFTWYFFFTSMITFTVPVFLYIYMSGYSLILSMNISYFTTLDFNMTLYLTPMSLIFTMVVLLISTCVISFSSYYMRDLLNTTYFVWLTVLFVLSMLIVINFGDLVMLMLGWDGLGVVSFLLIVFYQSPNSIFSGVFTLFMNRVGDALLLVTITMMLYTSGSWNMWGTTFGFYLGLVLLLGLMTKSAIFPFSPWLPSAMAAPTPISSLVHSSTLVTAGLYLMFRYSDYIFTNIVLCKLLCVVSVFTSFYAGLNSLLEADLKKVVALSTLSHLGFIGFSFSLGWLSLAFIHLISHASFKSLLFMTLGCQMTSLGHYQESRYLSSSLTVSPSSSLLMTVAGFNLLGLPFMSGFYSKDLVLEVIGYSFTGAFLQIVVYLNIIFTFSYTLRILSSCYYYTKFNPLLLTSKPPMYLVFSLFFLSLVSVCLVFFVLLNTPCLPFSIPLLLKWYPLMTLTLLLLYFLLISPSISSHWSSLLVYWVSTMMFLSPSLSNSTSVFWVNMTKHINSYLEYGVLHSLMNYSLGILVKPINVLGSLTLINSYYMMCLLGICLIMII